MKSDRVRQREVLTTPAHLTAVLAHVDRYGLTVYDFQTHNGRGGTEIEYQVCAYQTAPGVTAVAYVAGIRERPGMPVEFVVGRRYTRSKVAETMGEAAFQVRLAELGRLVTRHGVSVAEMNDVLFYYNLVRLNKRSGLYTYAVTSLSRAVAVHRCDLPWRLKEDLLRFHCDVKTLLGYDGFMPDYVIAMYGLDASNYRK